MSLFSFGDIRFNTTNRRGFGPTSNLLGGKYGYNILKYPADLGNYGKGHYMVIHVNEQKKSEFRTGPVNNGDEPTIFENRRNIGSPTLGSNFSNISSAVLDRLDSATSGAVGNINAFLNNNNVNMGTFGLSSDRDTFNVGFARTIQRTTDTIALYMPDTLNFVYNQQYANMNLGGTIPAAVLTGGESIVDAINNNPNAAGSATADAVKNLSPFILSLAANRAGNIGQVFFAAAAQMVQNPMLEILYSSPAFRTFRFDFMFYPRDEKEALEVQKILNRLQFHQAPEVNTDSNGFFLVPPSEFDIQFYYNGKENPNIPKISTCVLETIDVDYAPNGFSAYEVMGENVPGMGRTGMPVAIRLSLQFKETEYLLKDHFGGKRSTNFSSYLGNGGDSRSQPNLDYDEFGN
jgi:hypothetical protein